MWTNQQMTIGSPNEGQRKFRCEIKHFQIGSEYGIDGGRISKLWVQDMATGKTVINYDRGWDIKPQTECEIAALEALMNQYN